MATKKAVNGSGNLDGATFNYTLSASFPLLMHFDNILADDESAARGKDPGGKAGDDRHPADKWKQYLYADEENKYVAMPFNNIMAALRYVGSKIPMPRPVVNLKILSQVGIQLLEPFAEFTVGGRRVAMADIEGIGGTFADQVAQARDLGFSLDVRGVSVNGKRHVRVRPRFADWKVRGTFMVMDPVFNAQLLTKLWDLAGKMAGLGDWRPGCSGRQRIPGPYGRFTVELEQT